MIRCTLSFCRKFVCGVIGCCLVASAGTALADSKPAKSATAAKAAEAKPSKAEQDAMMAEMMKYANPGEQHKALEPLVGTWKASTKMWMGSPEPQTSEGTCERSWIMGGRFLMAKHTGNMMGMPFEGMEILGYDIRSGQYVSTWIDNMGTSISVTTSGAMDPATKTLTMNMPMFDPTTNAMAPYKNATKIVDNNTNVFTITGVRGGKETTELEITYTRVK
jgi:hypothetical protein